jgi:DNA-binding NtrC family response regulator
MMMPIRLTLFAEGLGNMSNKQDQNKKMILANDSFLTTEDPYRKRDGMRGATVRGSEADPVATQGPQIVAVDDDPMMLRVLSSHLRRAGYSPIAVDNGDTALEIINGETAVVLLDLRMPGKSGMDCLRFIRKHHPDTRVIVLTSSEDVGDAITAMREGAAEYVRKPYATDELLVFVEKAIGEWKMRRENSDLRESLSTSIPADIIPTHTQGEAKLNQSISRIAELDSTVLIGGESGTGKSTVARLIHQQGPRASGPFVAVNCASLPRDLIESELFGHTKGAFTGAVKDRPGRVEVADGGTLFLDEIGDLPLELQPKLLTFLQDRTIQRIGCNDVRKVDVRLIVATHRDLASMCQANCFRTDLYYRLNVLRIVMPSLRERLDEIPMLAASILARISKRQRIPTPAISDDAVLELARYGWPGNIRELENVLERAVAFCKQGRIELDDLMFDTMVGGSLHAIHRPELATMGTSAHGVGLVDATAIGGGMVARPMELPMASLAGKTLDEIERLAIEQTLVACRGNKAKSARMLGISEKSIYNKIKRLDVDVQSAEQVSV